MASDKINYTLRMRTLYGTLAKTLDDMRELERIYFDRGYNVGGTDPILDAEIAGTEITAANVASGITGIQQLNNFRDNAAVATGDYDVTINVIRNDI